jgi:hypothetical protein
MLVSGPGFAAITGQRQHVGQAPELAAGVGAGMAVQGADIARGVTVGVLVFVITRMLDRLFFSRG